MSTTSLSRSVVVGSKVGLHARPAALIAKAVKALDATVSLQKGEKTVVANSPLRIISLGAACGDEVTVLAEGPGAEAALAEIAALVEQDLDAD
jgi:phosphotransferase system HPr (HPr) family protein